MAVQEFKSAVFLSQLRPQTIHAEVPVEHLGIMKQNNATWTQFPFPCLKIVAYGFVGMQSVDVQQIDTAVVELTQSFVKSHPKQLGKTTISGVNIWCQIIKNGIIVITGLIIPPPGVNSV